MNEIKVKKWSPEVFNRKLFFPPKRWGHASFIFSDFLYILGGTVGSNEEEYLKLIYKIYLKDLNFTEWFIIHPNDSLSIIPFNRDSMGCQILKNQVYIFGGSILGKNSTNEVLVFDIYKEIWKKREIKNKGYPKDSFSSFIFDNKFIYIWGGITTIKNENKLEDKNSIILYYLDIEANEWITIDDEKIRSKFPYTYIWNHSGVLYNNKYYFYGGIIKNKDDNNLNISNELWELSIIKKEYKKFEENDSLENFSDLENEFNNNHIPDEEEIIEKDDHHDYEYEFKKIDYESFDEKIPLIGHTCNLIEDKLVIIGGETIVNGSKTPNKVIFYYDFKKNKTFKIINNYTDYNGLIKHTCNNYNNKLIIFGGRENEAKTNNLLEIKLNNEFFSQEKKDVEERKCFNCRMNYKLTKNSLNFDINLNLKSNISEYLLGYHNGLDAYSIKVKLKLFIEFCLKFSIEIDNNFQAFSFLIYLLKDSKKSKIKFNLDEKILKAEFKAYPKSIAFELLNNFEYNSNNFLFFCSLMKLSTKILIGFMDGKSTFLIYFEFLPYTTQKKIFFNDYEEIKKLFLNEEMFYKMINKIKKKNSFIIYLLNFNYSEELYQNKNNIYQKQHFNIISNLSNKIKLNDYIKLSLSNYKNKLIINKNQIDFYLLKKKWLRKQIMKNHWIIKSYYIKSIEDNKLGQICIYSKDFLIQIIEFKGKNALIEIHDNEINIFRNKISSQIENSIIEFISKFKENKENKENKAIL